jgi:hypothetical protein
LGKLREVIRVRKHPDTPTIAILRGSGLVMSLSSREFVEQRLGVPQVGGIEAFGEPAVDFGENRAGLFAFALPNEQSRSGGVPKV